MVIRRTDAYNHYKHTYQSYLITVLYHNPNTGGLEHPDHLKTNYYMKHNTDAMDL